MIHHWLESLLRYVPSSSISQTHNLGRSVVACCALLLMRLGSTAFALEWQVAKPLLPHDLVKQLHHRICGEEAVSRSYCCQTQL